jgi:hypothetical protein
MGVQTGEKSPNSVHMCGGKGYSSAPLMLLMLWWLDLWRWGCMACRIGAYEWPYYIVLREKEEFQVTSAHPLQNMTILRDSQSA